MAAILGLAQACTMIWLSRQQRDPITNGKPVPSLYQFDLTEKDKQDISAKVKIKPRIIGAGCADWDVDNKHDLKMSLMKRIDKNLFKRRNVLRLFGNV